LIANLEKAKIHYSIKGTGIPIVMFNGYTTDMRMMKGCMEPIFADKKGWKRIYLDEPGVGKTVIKENYQNHNDIFDIILEFIEEVIEKEKFVLAGYSFGGYLAKYILSKKINMIEGLLLICPVINPKLEELDIEEDIDTNLISENRRINKRIKREIIKSMERTDFEYLKEVREDVTLNYNNLVEINQTFNKPVLVITGKQDTDVGYRDAYQFSNSFNRATYCVLDKAGHNIHIEQENIFNLLTNEWLNRVEQTMNIHS
jgi:pimeloyl-ACP methyl ester carboxylesterase